MAIKKLTWTPAKANGEHIAVASLPEVETQALAPQDEPAPSGEARAEEMPVSKDGSDAEGTSALESIKIIQNALRLGNYPRETFRLKPGVYVNDFAFVAKQTIEAYRAWLSEENWFAQHIRVPDIVEELRLLAEETQVLLTPSPS